MDPSRCPAGSRRCAIRRRCSSSCCATSPARVQLVHPRTDVEEGSRAGCRRRDDLGADDRHLPHRDRRAEARRAGQARRPRGQDRRARRRGSSPSRCRSPRTPSVDKRLDCRFIDLRRPETNLIFRVQTTFEHALRTWWVEHDFIEIHTPKLMDSPSESRAELFQVPYFETTAYLAQSPQHFKQMAPGRRLRQGLRGRAGVPRRPELHLAARHRVHSRRHRAQLDRLATRTSWPCTSSCSSRASRRSSRSTAPRSRPLFGSR